MLYESRSVDILWSMAYVPTIQRQIVHKFLGCTDHTINSVQVLQKRINVVYSGLKSFKYYQNKKIELSSKCFPSSMFVTG